MDENLEGIQRPICHNLWVYWLTQLIMLVMIGLQRRHAGGQPDAISACVDNGLC